MAVHFVHIKKKMSEARAWHKWHIFANPDMPEICPILSLARYRATSPQIQRERFFRAVRSAVDSGRFRIITSSWKNAAAIQRLGIEPKDFGVHSIRKGAATYCCNGTTAGAAFPAVYVRAGWYMGGIGD